MWDLKKVRLKNPKHVVIGNLYINSIPGKCHQLKCLISNHVDVLALAETKLDEMFATSSFLTDGFSLTFQLGQNWNGVGILIYLRIEIHSKLLTKHSFPNDIEGLFVKINFRKRKWLLFGTYHPPSQNDQYYFYCLEKALIVYSSYGKVILTDSLNARKASVCLIRFFINMI